MLVALCPVCKQAKNYCKCPDGDPSMKDKSVEGQITRILWHNHRPLFGRDWDDDECPGQKIACSEEAQGILKDVKIDSVPLKRVVELWEQGKIPLAGNLCPICKEALTCVYCSD